MKSIYLFLITVLLLSSCKKDKTPPYSETITKGQKWGIRIGSSPSEVYARLQELAAEKGGFEVALVYRQPYTKPQDIQQQIEFYNSLTLGTASGQVDRAILFFSGNKVESIGVGGALPVEVAKWPQDVPDQLAIHMNDPVSSIYAKLLAIYQLHAYSSYQLILPDKTLAKPFDPDMGNYDEWAFTFFTRVNSSTTGSSSVRLFFKNGKLDKIRHSYTEGEVVI